MLEKLSSTIKTNTIFYLFYLCILFLSQYIFFDYFNVYHGDHFHYLEKAIIFKDNYNFYEILVRMFFSFSTNINLPLIYFHSLFLKLFNSTLPIVFINTFFTLLIFNKINQIITLFNFKKIKMIEFLLLTSFLTYFNIGINKEIITVLLLLFLIYETMKFFTLENKITIYFKIVFVVYLFSLIKPLHATFIILIFIFCFIFFLYTRKKKVIMWFALFLINLFFILLNLIDNRYAESINYFNFVNLYEYINLIRINIHNTGLTNSTLEYLNTSNLLLDSSFFTLNNFYLVIHSFMSSLLFPSINDFIFAIHHPSRYILFIFIDSILIKVGVFYAIYNIIFKRRLVTVTYYIIILFLLVIFTLILSITVPNDGISYRYLYPYKFIFIFLGYMNLKLFFNKFFGSLGRTRTGTGKFPQDFKS